PDHAIRNEAIWLLHQRPGLTAKPGEPQSPQLNSTASNKALPTSNSPLALPEKTVQTALKATRETRANKALPEKTAQMVSLPRRSGTSSSPALTPSRLPKSKAQ